jgi:hypothetical protein
MKRLLLMALAAAIALTAAVPTALAAERKMALTPALASSDLPQVLNIRDHEHHERYYDGHRYPYYRNYYYRGPYYYPYGYPYAYRYGYPGYPYSYPPDNGFYFGFRW